MLLETWLTVTCVLILFEGGGATNRPFSEERGTMCGALLQMYHVMYVDYDMYLFVCLVYMYMQRVQDARFHIHVHVHCMYVYTLHDCTCTCVYIA